ncbi:hypothetical protein C1J03_22450 [Sulfitobacter sp. SK012]|uniref:hypothetical protein n=1 Tax=Sulfitobacter sp. SK012 TaxID=1389005 RepID=UPI000E0C0275|nr:hypothetical protein [Sulfitobacter sp. SK012]AXI48512.1 hypothetical protein C1J03_22450 [Sulfitobacter sp. SK012]
MLKLVLRANAVSCAFFGALFAFAGPATANFTGNPPVLLVQVLGAGLLINALMLVWKSLSADPDRLSILAFALGDAIWVVATALLLITGVWITTAGGIIWAVGIATFVGACGAMQWKLAPNWG